MKTSKKAKRSFVTVFVLAVLALLSPVLLAAPNKTEAELIQMVCSGDYRKMNDALDRLPNWYPNSKNAVQIIRGILRSNEVLIVTQPAYQPPPTGSRQGQAGSWMRIPAPRNMLVRMTARALGNYHATLDEAELNVIYSLLSSRDEECAMDGLKALRGLNAPQAVPKIIPLLDDQNAHVVRDACRTLAVLGDASTIPFIEPLLKRNLKLDIKWDAQHAIAKLKSKH